MTNANSISTISNNQTMSSLEIAKITNKRHPDVIRDIRSMIDSIKDDAEMLHELNQGVVDIKDNRSYTKEFKLNRFIYLVPFSYYYDALNVLYIAVFLRLQFSYKTRQFGVILYIILYETVVLKIRIVLRSSPTFLSVFVPLSPFLFNTIYSKWHIIIKREWIDKEQKHT